MARDQGIGLQGQAAPLFDREADEQFAQWYRVVTEGARNAGTDPASTLGSQQMLESDPSYST
jgi:hypothetical protein